MTTFDYAVTIMGCDASFDDGELTWGDEHELVHERHFDSQEEAIEYLRSISRDQVIVWEKESRCNSLDAIIQRDEFEDGEFVRFVMTGEAEWVGAELNGIWDENWNRVE